MMDGTSDREPHRLTVKRGLLAPLILFASQTLVGLGLSLGASFILNAGDDGAGVIDGQLIGMLAVLIGGVMALLWIWTDVRRFGPRFARQIGLRPSVLGTRQTALLVIVLLTATHLVAWIYRSVILPLVGQEGVVGGGSQMFAHLRDLGSPYWMAAFMVLALLAGPVFEEFMYRGYLQSALKRRIPRWGAITITSLVFMAGHGPPVLWPMYFVFSAAWGWVFAQTESLKAAIAFHVLNNLFYTVIAVMGWKILA